MAGAEDDLDSDTIMSTSVDDAADDQAFDDTELGVGGSPLPAIAHAPTAVRPVSRIALVPTDVVPEFRRELTMTRTAGGYEFRDPRTGQSHHLNEYELSLARMLDGRRLVFELLEASGRLGIPVNLESLQTFLQHLERLGLVRPRESLDEAFDRAVSSTWPSRGEWESSVRALFQSGIRLLRMGKHAEAAGYFEALLQEDPDNVEARELLQMARQAPPPPVAAPAPSSAPLPIAATRVALPPPPATASSRRRYLVVAAIAALAVVVVVVLTRAAVRAPSQSPAPPDRPATIAAVPLAQDAAAPDAGARPDATSSGPDATVLTDAASEPPQDGSDAPAQPELAVFAPTGGELASFLRSPQHVHKGDKLFVVTHSDADPKRLAAAKAKVDEMRELAKRDPIYETFLADARAELAKAMKVSAVAVRAPRDGYAEPKASHGATVHAGQVLAQLK